MDATAAATANHMVKMITLLDVILMLHSSWMNDVSPVTICNCWQTCGLKKNEVIEECSGLSDVDENENNIDFDSDLPTCRPSTDKDIIAVVHKEFWKGTDAEEDVEEEEVESYPSGKEMRLAMATVKRGLIPRGFDNYTLLDEMDKAIEDTLLKLVSQMSIGKYLSK